MTLISDNFQNPTTLHCNLLIITRNSTCCSCKYRCIINSFTLHTVTFKIMFVNVPEEHIKLCVFILQDLPKPVRANFILNVETDELFITAGLQDRVVQVNNLISTPYCKPDCTPFPASLRIDCSFAGLWRLSLHGFQQKAYGRAGLR